MTHAMLTHLRELCSFRALELAQQIYYARRGNAAKDDTPAIRKLIEEQTKNAACMAYLDATIRRAA